MVTTRQQMLNNRLKQYLEAETKILQGQSYTIDNRTLTRASLAEVRDAIDDLIDLGATIDDGASEAIRRTKRVIFVD